MMYDIKDFTKEFKIYNTVEFRKLDNFDNYFIYEDGRVYSIKRNIFLKPTYNTDRYLKIGIVNNEKKRKFISIHRLVYEAFKGPIPKELQVDHINGLRDDNRLINLRLLTNKENNKNHHHLEIYKDIEKEKYMKKKEKKREYNEKHKEQVLKQNRAYYEEHREEILKKMRQNYKDFYEKNKEEIKRKQKERYYNKKMKN